MKTRWILHLFVFGGLIVTNLGFLNLYLNSTETRRLLGIEGDLFYVRNGTVNDYALSFNLLIRPEHDQIFFCWQDLRTGTHFPMLYSWVVETEEMDEEVMLPPQPSIPAQGEVPTRLSVFSVNLGCLGTETTEVNIKFILDIAIYGPSNITTLEIRRRKSCVLNIDKISTLQAAPTKIFYIAVGSACGIILLVVLVVAIYYVKSRKSTSEEQFSDTNSSKGLATQTTQSFLRPETPSNSITSGPALKRSFSISELKPSEVRTLLGEIHVERSLVTLGEVLMEGTFGRIYHGTLSLAEEEQDVLIKTVSSDVAHQEQVNVLLREGCLLKGLICQNLLPIMVTCIEPDMEPLLIYNYAMETNLKKFLLCCKVSDLGPHQSLSTQQFVYLAIQVCRGLQYLHRRQIVHKDVACRNCVVDSQWTVRVTDNALSRDLFPNDYHCLGDNENRPVKWLAPEALEKKKFTTASDVWSFGVLLWELMRMGLQPYSDIDPFEMATYLQEGYRVAQPPNCPDELFAVMACCWAIGVDERPKITQLQLCLQDFYQALGRYI